MSSELRIAMLVLGALLVLVAALGSRLFAAASPAISTALRALLGIAGLALLAWLLVPQLQAPVVPAAVVAPPVAPTPAASPAPPAVDLVRVATQALEDCAVAAAPAIPDGSKSSRAQMLAARSAFQAYDADTNHYLACVDAAVDAARKSSPNAPEADLKSLQTLGTSAHNTAIDQEQAVADELNKQVRAFKSKHPQG